ncbi:unnamed protein product [Fusarium graminearum]
MVSKRKAKGVVARLRSVLYLAISNVVVMQPNARQRQTADPMSTARWKG